MASNPIVTARPTGLGRFQTEIALTGAPILADEPAEVGGTGTGPTPYQLLSAALAACTAMTIRLYAERKGWALPPFSVEAGHEAGPARDRFSRRIAFDAPLDAEQEAKLGAIADKCPVHRTLSRGSEIVTEIGAAAPPPKAEPAAQHERDMEAACRD